MFQQNILAHGFHQLIHSNRTIFERIFWWFMILAAFWGAIFSASVFVTRHIDRPTVISIERDYTTWNSTFPAFSVCSKQNMNETALANYLFKMRHRYSDRNLTENFLRMLVQLNMNNLETFFDFTEIRADDHLSIVDELTNNYNYDIAVDAPKKLKMVRTITELGICETFNSQLNPYLSPSFYTTNVLPPKMPIFHTNYLDAKAFAMIEQLESSDIYFHGPFDLASSIPFTDIGVDSMQYAGFVFSVMSMSADSKLRNLFIGQRKCRFLDESNLPHFPSVYSFDLCKTQCKIELMKRVCGCVPFFYKKRDDEIYCESFSCVHHHEGTIRRDCDQFGCMTNCVDVKFNLKKFNQMAWFRGNKFRIDVDKPTLRMKREVIYSFTDVLVAIGATFALFTGISVLSFTKVIYFIVDRLARPLRYSKYWV